MRYSTLMYAQGCTAEGIGSRRSESACPIRVPQEDKAQYFANASMFSRRSKDLRKKVTGKLYTR